MIKLFESMKEKTADTDVHIANKVPIPVDVHVHIYVWLCLNLACYY